MQTQVKVNHRQSDLTKQTFSHAKKLTKKLAATQKNLPWFRHIV